MQQNIISSTTNIPLAARMRPNNLEGFIGQKKIAGKDKPIRKLIKSDQLVSMIFWGPPGSGKTTLARIIANETKSEFFQMSAVDSGKADVKKVVESSRKKSEIQESIFSQKEKSLNNSNNKIKQISNRTILFIDEIHRFNKAQQDFLLPYVEDGTIILIGATTENPSFEVISALLSRCRVFVLDRHTIKNIKIIIRNALKDKENGLGEINIEIKKDALDFLAQSSNGDPRTALNALEMAVKLLVKVD